MGGTIAGLGFSVLDSTRIENVTGKLIIMGASGAYNARITNVEEVYCIGSLSCNQAYITKINYVYINGLYALSQTTIESDLDGGDMTIEIRDLAQGTNIICSENDYCHIICYDSSYCVDIIYTCYDNCNFTTYGTTSGTTTITATATATATDTSGMYI